MDNLTIFGTHDTNTIDQMKLVAARPGVLKAALLPDGHLGKGISIGGVAALDGWIDPAYVSVDIACFSGDTKIYTLDGKNPTMKDVCDKKIEVISYKPDGNLVVTRANCFLARKNAEIIKIQLDNGEVIKCTPDHLFMLRDGKYLPANELTSGTSLMPFYRTKNKDGYVLVRNVKTNRLIRLHWLAFHSGLLQEAPECINDTLVIHHKNFVKDDNSSDNLVPMTNKSHALMHARMRDHAHFNTPEFTKHKIKCIKKFWKNARNDEEFMNKRAKTATENSRYGAVFKRESFKDNGKRGAKYLIAFNTNPETIKRATDRAKIKRYCPVCSTQIKSSNSLANHAKKNHSELLNSIKRTDGITDRRTVMKKLQSVSNNHKVVDIEYSNEFMDVYCLNVPEYHNFALTSGIFVHNCGNAAIKTDKKLSDFGHDPKKLSWMLNTIADEINNTISFGVGRKNNAPDAPVNHELFNSDRWNIIPRSYRNELFDKARSQIGTTGSGNHFVDLFVDESGYLWAGVHFGSRGLGYTIASSFIAIGQGGQWGDRVAEAPVRLDLLSQAGKDYWELMELAGEYAYAGREWAVRKVVEIIGAKEIELVHNHHNFAFKEIHSINDELREVVVVRKGATPAFPNQKGFVGGSMGDNSVILEGAILHPEFADAHTIVDNPAADLQKSSLYSTVHGAGRVMSRTEAAGKRDRKTGQLKLNKETGLPVKLPKVDAVEWKKWMDNFGVILRGGGLDESPFAYRRLPEVLNSVKDTIKILHTLKPLIVVMAGANEFDPYSDS